jgi:hypothetical protein
MEEMIEALAALSHAQQKQAVIVVEQPVHSPGHEMAVPEQLRHADAAFAQQDREASAVAGWLTLWAGSLLLKDILKDALTPPADEREEKLKAHQKDCDCC